MSSNDFVFIIKFSPPREGEMKEGVLGISETSPSPSS